MTAIIVHVEDNAVKGWMTGKDVQDLINQCQGSWTESVSKLAISLMGENPPTRSVVEFHKGYWLIDTS